MPCRLDFLKRGVPRLVPSAVTVLGVAVLSACGASAPEAPSSTRAATLTAFQLYHSAPVVAASESPEILPHVNCVADAGLDDLTIIRRSRGPEIVDALVGGSADFGTLALTPVVFQLLQDSQFVIFATLMTTDHDIKVVGRRSAGVASGGDLAGKRLGYVGGTFGEIFLDRYLEKHGLAKSDLSLTTAGPAQLRDLFLSESLDALVIWEPVVQDILLDPASDTNDVFIDADPTVYTGRINLVARPEILESRRAEAEALVAAMLCGERVLHDRPAVVQEHLERWLDRRPGTLDGVFETDIFRVVLDVPTLVEELRREAGWARTAVFSGNATLPPDFGAFVDASVLAAVAPDRVIQ